MSTDKKMFNLHIGMPKTGTTTLQSHLFPEHPDLDYLGTYIKWKGTPQQNCRDTEVLEFAQELLWKNFRNPNMTRCKELYNKWADHAAAEDKALLWSWESLMENNHTVQLIRAENLKEVAGEARVIACLRHPVSLMESLYVQLLKRDNIGEHAKKGKKHRFESVEQWLKNGLAKGRAPTNHLDYAETLQVFAGVFGKENIKVLLFEQLVENQDAFIRELCEFIEIDPEQGIQLARGKRTNERWSQEQLDRLKALNRSPLRALQFRFSDKNKRARLLGIHPDTPPTGPKAIVDIPLELKREIKERTRGGNRMLQEQWGLPLEQYGYPV